MAPEQAHTDNYDIKTDSAEWWEGAENLQLRTLLGVTHNGAAALERVQRFLKR